jgi:hypothetical protein
MNLTDQDERVPHQNTRQADQTEKLLLIGNCFLTLRGSAPQRRFRPFGLEEFRREPASGRCGVSPLEWGGRDADSTAGIMPNAGACRIAGHLASDHASFDAA